MFDIKGFHVSASGAIQGHDGPLVLQVTSIFSFSHNVFKSFLSQGRLKLGLCGKELNVARRMTYVFDRIENNVEEGENAGYPHFLLFSKVTKGLCCKGLRFEFSLAEKQFSMTVLVFERVEAFVRIEENVVIIIISFSQFFLKPFC